MRRREFLEMRRLPRRGRPHRGGVKPEGDEGSYFANLTPAEERLNFARPKGRLLAAEKHREKNQDREDSET